MKCANPHFHAALPGFNALQKQNRQAGKGIWQRRTWEDAIRDDTDFARHADDIQYNPVKHGLVQRVADRPFSSFHRTVAQGLLSADWAGDAKQPSGSFGD